MRIYENTHPPLTKLLVTLSVMLFGGLGHGDNSWGWRFLDVVFGAIVDHAALCFCEACDRLDDLCLDRIVLAYCATGCTSCSRASARPKASWSSFRSVRSTRSIASGSPRKSSRAPTPWFRALAFARRGRRFACRRRGSSSGYGISCGSSSCTRRSALDLASSIVVILYVALACLPVAAIPALAALVRGRQARVHLPRRRIRSRRRLEPFALRARRRRRSRYRWKSAHYRRRPIAKPCRCAGLSG